MTYILEAFLVKQSEQDTLTEAFEHAIAVPIEQDIALIPCTEALLNEINQNNPKTPFAKFMCMTEHIEIQILKHIGNTKVAYVEADFFGGAGKQHTIIWANGQRIYLSEDDQWEIDYALRELGVQKQDGKNEFDTVGLGEYRRTASWLKKISEKE